MPAAAMQLRDELLRHAQKYRARLARKRPDFFGDRMAYSESGAIDDQKLAALDSVGGIDSP